MISRVVAVLAAAWLIAAAIARAVRTPPVDLSHPRGWIVAVVCCLLGLRIVAHARRNPVGWLILAMGACAAVAIGAEAWTIEHWLAWIGTWIWWPSYSLVPIISLLFPNGRLLPGWWWLAFAAVGALGVVLPAIGIGWASWSAPATFWSDAVNGTARRGAAVGLGLVGLLCFLLSSVGAIVSLLVRCRRATGNRRRLLGWAAACAILAVPALIVELLSTVWVAWAVVAAAFPAAALIAILRYGLYNIDLLIHRTLLYGLLTLALAGAYALAIAATPFPNQEHIAGAVVVALVLAPVHRGLRSRVDRWLYGDLADPYRALTRLGEQLHQPMSPDKLLTSIAGTVGEALKVPYVAVSLDVDGESRLLATFGESHDWPRVRIPVRHGNQEVAEFEVELRAPDERLGQREHRLLADLARQAAPAAHSVRLTQELRRADERFAREREETLRQLGRNLHDDIGPSLAGVRLQVRAARKLMGEENPRARQRLDEAVEDLTELSASVRDLISKVRPRDLLDSVRRLAERFTGPDFTVWVTAEDPAEQLPAVIEQEAYRIVSEALTNVSKHANARNCWIVISRTTDLLVSITDDGTGIPSAAVNGVGLESMRRRCEDLGGEFDIVSQPGKTRIQACLPLGND